MRGLIFLDRLFRQMKQTGRRVPPQGSTSQVFNRTGHLEPERGELGAGPKDVQHHPLRPTAAPTQVGDLREKTMQGSGHSVPPGCDFVACLLHSSGYEGFLSKMENPLPLGVGEGRAELLFPFREEGRNESVRWSDQGKVNKRKAVTHRFSAVTNMFQFCKGARDTPLAQATTQKVAEL